MPRTLTPELFAEKEKEFNCPVEIYQVYLDEQTLYFAMCPKNIEFFDEQGNSATYYAADLSRAAVKTNIETKVDQTEVQISNVNREMSAYIANTDFQGRRLVIWKVFLGCLDDPNNYVVIFDGIMDEPRVDQYTVAVTVVSKLDTLDRELPGRTYEVQCSWPSGFGGEECGKVIAPKNGTVDSVSVDRMTIYDAVLTEVAGYWKFGMITIGKESRVVTESGTGCVRVEYPFYIEVPAGTEYILEAGCDKGFDTAHGCQYWNNTNYYGGFLSIPRIRDVREVAR
jgi:hypothetical protein